MFNHYLKQALFLFLFFVYFAGIYISSSEPGKDDVSEFNYIEDSIYLSDSVRSYLSIFEKDFALQMKRRGIPGGAVVIVKDSMVIFEKGFGVKVKGSSDSVSANTIFRIGSVSKGFASILAGTFVDQEKLAWNDPIVDHLPDFKLSNPDQTERVEVQHILSHTSGLPRHSYTNLIEDGLSLNRIIPRLENVGLISEEGSQIAYQNAAYAVIEKVLEANSDSTFEALLHENLFSPLDMESSSASYQGINKAKDKALPHLYHSRRKGLLPSSISKKYYNAISAGGINTSISDMGKWLLMLTGNNPEVISGETLDSIFEPRATINNKRFSRYWESASKSHYGLGWRILDNNGQEVIYHGGYVNGYRSEIAFDRKNKIGICILFNSSSGYALQAIPAFFNEFSQIETPLLFGSEFSE